MITQLQSMCWHRISYFFRLDQQNKNRLQDLKRGSEFFFLTLFTGSHTATCYGLSGSATIPRCPYVHICVMTSQHNKNNCSLYADCFDQTKDVEYTCKQRTLTLRWPTTRFYGTSEASALSRDQYIFTKRAEFMHLIHGPQMFALNVLKNQPP